MKKVAIIGGSGLYDVENPSEAEELNIVTPWGPTSDSILKVEQDGLEVYFLSRHGRGHIIGPSQINFRATDCTLPADLALGSVRHKRFDS